MASILKVDKLDPQSGTALEIGTSGDTITVPSGATLDISASTLTPPATLPASSGVNLTALNASNLGSGTVPTARLGSGTASSSTVLYGDQTYKAEPGFTAASITGQTDYGNIPPATGDSMVFYDTSATALREITIANLGNTPAFSRFDNAAQSIDSSTWTKLELDSGHFDTHSAFDATNERFVVPANCGGTYWFSYSVSIDNIYSEKYILGNLYLNGSSWNNSFSMIRGDNSFSAQSPAFARGSVIGELSATDYIELWIWHNHGSAYNTNAYATTLQGFRITGM